MSLAAPQTGGDLLRLIFDYGRAPTDEDFAVITAAIVDLYATREHALTLAEQSQEQAHRAVTMVDRLLHGTPR